MSTQKENLTDSTTSPNELKAEQALGLIGLGLMQKISREGTSGWSWSTEDVDEKADLQLLRQRLELTALALPTLMAEAPVMLAALIEEAAVIVVISTFSTPLIFKLPVPVTVERPAIVAVSRSAVVAVLCPPSVTESALVSDVPKNSFIQYSDLK